MAKLNSPLAKFLGIVVAVLGITVFTSWTTQKNIQDTMSNYAKYQFSQSVEAVLKQEGGVMDQLADIKIIAVQGRDISIQNRKDAHSDWVSAIQKYYKRMKNGQINLVTKENINMAKEHWQKMGEDEKDALLTSQYNYIIDHYDEAK